MFVLLHSNYYFAIEHFRFASLQYVLLTFLQVSKIFNQPFSYAPDEIYCRTNHFNEQLTDAAELQTSSKINHHIHIIQQMLQAFFYLTVCFDFFCLCYNLYEDFSFHTETHCPTEKLL